VKEYWNLDDANTDKSLASLHITRLYKFTLYLYLLGYLQILCSLLLNGQFILPSTVS